jgi:MFS family permease
MKSLTYRNYLLVLLLVIYALNFADRLAIGVALQGIKLSLHLSDTQLGFLTGIAFAAFYAIIGIPIARWIDRGNRVTVLALTAVLWSVMVALTGRAASFMQIMLVRVGVGVGDAGSFPVAQSLIPDHFNRTERPRATAVFMLGWPLALVLGFFSAGWLNQLYGWRAMFLILASPGLVIAPLAWLTLREPRLQRSPHLERHTEPSATIVSCTSTSSSSAQAAFINSSAAECPSIADVFVTLWRNATYRNLLLCYAVTSFFNAGVFQWQPAFFTRSFGMQSGEIGTWLALVLGTGSLVSIYAGGAMASRYAANNERLQFKVIAASYVCFGIDHALAYLSHNAYLAFVLLGVGAFVNAAGGPLLASIQTLVQPRMRGMSYAILLLFYNLIGLGLGPLVTGALSDALRPILGQESLRYALLALCPGFACGGWYMWRASTTVTRDLPTASPHNDASTVENPCGKSATAT